MECIRHVLEKNPSNRWSIDDILGSKFINHNINKNIEYDSIGIKNNDVPYLHDDMISACCNTLDINNEYLIKCLNNNKHNQSTTT